MKAADIHRLLPCHGASRRIYVADSPAPFVLFVIALLYFTWKFMSWLYFALQSSRKVELLILLYRLR